MGLESVGNRDGLVLVGYGSKDFNADWETLFEALCADAESDLGVTSATFAWCGHLMQYSKDPTAEAIRGVLHTCERALVLPVLVAYDEMFQKSIIGGAVQKVRREIDDPAPRAVRARRDPAGARGRALGACDCPKDLRISIQRPDHLIVTLVLADALDHF